MSNEFVAHMRVELSRLRGKDLKITVRASGRKMNTYEGRIAKLGSEDFEFDSEYPKGSFTLRFDKVHVWVVGDKVVFPLKRRK